MTLALWNGRDPILKERMFGLTGPEGNHGEDGKELYFYEDASPTASYARYRYLYPMDAFPYEALVRENARRGRHDLEFELLDATGPGALAKWRFWDVVVEWAKAGEQDICCLITVTNRSRDRTETIHVLPHLSFRNCWSWGYDYRRPAVAEVLPAGDAEVGAADGSATAASSQQEAATRTAREVRCVGWERHLGAFRWSVLNGGAEDSPDPILQEHIRDRKAAESSSDEPGGRAPGPGQQVDRHPSMGGCAYLGTDNESNFVRLFGPAAKNSQRSSHTKDAFHSHVARDGVPSTKAAPGAPQDSSTPSAIGQIKPKVSPEGGTTGPECTKAAAWCVETLRPGQQLRIRCRFRAESDVLARQRRAGAPGHSAPVGSPRTAARGSAHAVVRGIPGVGSSF